MDVLRKELNLQIEDYGQNPELSSMVRCYHKLLHDYMSQRGHDDIVHIAGKYLPIEGI
jgi:hypothetical protein